MRRVTVALVLGLGLMFWTAGGVLAAAAPITPTPDERAAPAATEKPAEKAPEAPAEKPKAAPSTEKPAEVATPAAKPEEKPTRPQDVQREAIEAQVEPAETDLTGLSEVALVEEVARARKSYDRALAALKQYYSGRGNATKTQWVDQEIEGFAKVPKQQYLTIQALAGPDLKPTRDIPAANQLFKEGMDFKNYPAFPPGKKDYLQTALSKFETVIQKYPDSNKIADAAFRMGEIYGGYYFQDYSRAVQCYERCWQWDPKTTNPAVFKAAKIYDEKLDNRVKAVELYNRVITESPDPDLQKQARERIKALTGK